MSKYPFVGRCRHYDTTATSHPQPWALEYYNTVDHIDGEFFAFTAAPDGTILLHSNPTKVGTHIDDLFGGAEISFTRDGSWLNSEGTDSQTGNTVTARVWGVDYQGTIIVAGWRNDGTR